MNFKQLFCGHNYKLENKFELKSEIDILRENGYVPNTGTSIKRKLITDYKCSICGRFKRLIEKT